VPKWEEEVLKKANEPRLQKLGGIKYRKAGEVLD
jgi:hypothetical protein